MGDCSRHKIDIAALILQINAIYLILQLSDYTQQFHIDQLSTLQRGLAQLLNLHSHQLLKRHCAKNVTPKYTKFLLEAKARYVTRTKM